MKEVSGRKGVSGQCWVANEGMGRLELRLCRRSRRVRKVCETARQAAGGRQEAGGRERSGGQAARGGQTGNGRGGSGLEVQERTKGAVSARVSEGVYLTGE